MKYTTRIDGEWHAPIRRNYRMACCDCGLTHRVDFRIIKRELQLRAFRDERSTGQIRRWMKKRRGKMSQMTVWTIESGEYSDYSVDGVFSTAENAEAVMEKLKSSGSAWGGDYRIVERELDPGVEALREGYKRFYVLMLFDGAVESIREDDWGISTEFNVWRRSRAPINKGKDVPDCLSATLLARDEQHAIKIVNEKRAQKIAIGEWQPDAG